MSAKNHMPKTVAASLDARLAPFHLNEPALEDLDVGLSRAVSPRTERKPRLSLVNDLKLLFAALGAGGNHVHLGDNQHTVALLSNYAASLRDH